MILVLECFDSGGMLPFDPRYACPFCRAWAAGPRLESPLVARSGIAASSVQAHEVEAVRMCFGQDLVPFFAPWFMGVGRWEASRSMPSTWAQPWHAVARRRGFSGGGNAWCFTSGLVCLEHMPKPGFPWAKTQLPRVSPVNPPFGFREPSVMAGVAPFLEGPGEPIKFIRPWGE